MIDVSKDYSKNTSLVVVSKRYVIWLHKQRNIYLITIWYFILYILDYLDQILNSKKYLWKDRAKINVLIIRYIFNVSPLEQKLKWLYSIILRALVIWCYI